MPCPALPCIQGRAKKKFISHFQGRAGPNISGHRAGQGVKNCPVTVSGLELKF